jgi:HlyD family secretion protein
MADTSTSRTRTVTILAGVLVVAGILVYAVRSSQDMVEVRWARASYQDLASTVPTNGKVEPIDEFQAHATTPGMVEKIYGSVGQKVNAGTPLIRMSGSDAYARLASSNAALATQKAAEEAMQRGGTQDELNAFHNDLSRAEMAKQQAEKSLADVKALEQKGADSAGEVLAAEQRVANAQAQIDSIHQRMTNRSTPADVNRSRAAVADAEAAVAAAQQAVAESDIHSKIAGTIYSIPVHEYDYVSTGDELVDVADLTKMQVRAYFDEPDIGKLVVGQPVSIVWAAKPNQTWYGHIERVPTIVKQYGTRNVGECFISVDDAKGDLLPNTSVTVTVTTKQRPHVLSIPHEALHIDGARDYVYTIRDGRLVQTTVQVGLVNATSAEITSGLLENQQVVLNATTNIDLANGLKVKAVD